MKITGPQEAQLTKAILDNYSAALFEALLKERLNLRLDNIAAAKFGFDIQCSKAVEDINFKSGIPKLLSSLIADRAEEDIFRQLAYEWGVHPGFYESDPAKSVGTSYLEKLINANQFVDVQVFLKALADASRCVCRIQVVATTGQTCWGTGFLVAENLLLTNYHVMEAVILDNSLAGQVRCKFDYELNEAGSTINPGIDYGLDIKSPIAASSPPHQFDMTGSPQVNVAWPPDRLDYALLRLDQDVGSQKFGINAKQSKNPEAPTRGWIRRIGDQPILDKGLNKGANIIIIQHPDKQPMKVAFGFSQIVGSDTGKQRVRYTTNTMGGSSGSPCFDEQFNWIGLHNMGDPNYFAAYNQGIVALRVVEDLAKKGYSLY